MSALPQYLYRIAPLERILNVIASNCNYLTTPECWEDPYEAAHLKAEIETPVFGVKIGNLYYTEPKGPNNYVIGSMRQGTNAAKNVYGQCWSSLQESDAMWRIYSPSLEGVKIRIESTTLLSSLKAKMQDEECYLGKVEYISQNTLEAELADFKANYLLQRRPDGHAGPPGERIANSLLKKRSQFSHEHEYRLLLIRAGARRLQDAPKILKYQFTLNELVEEIETDPRCQNHVFIEKQLRNAGFTGRVKQSSLYTQPILSGPAK